ncbi:12525_t:CDS:2, partial [Cetraspora pellucida]
MANKKQPEWHVPISTESLPTLKIYNSLTRTKENRSAGTIVALRFMTRHILDMP